MEFSCVAWSGRGETPVGLARQSETPEAKLRRLSASPTESEPLERKATSLFKGTNKYTIDKPLYLKFRGLSTVCKERYSFHSSKFLSIYLNQAFQYFFPSFHYGLLQSNQNYSRPKISYSHLKLDQIVRHFLLLIRLLM